MSAWMKAGWRADEGLDEWLDEGRISAWMAR